MFALFSKIKEKWQSNQQEHQSQISVDSFEPLATQYAYLLRLNFDGQDYHSPDQLKYVMGYDESFDFNQPEQDDRLVLACAMFCSEEDFATTFANTPIANNYSDIRQEICADFFPQKHDFVFDDVDQIAIVLKEVKLDEAVGKRWEGGGWGD